ncbi:hypothetical protein LCGC14_3014440 [marine sediment metagenome]|uniref:DUF4488 domain-containing protein n=1 Tax=marine sediment metagenome TaxID=412755 RepID=A0A0F8WX77_9ZZZZ|nr:hypothetical protein [Bacteroides sp.]
MKSNYFKTLLILLFVIAGALTTNAQIPKQFIGSWDFTAPSADYEFQNGIMEIKKDSIFTTFTGASYILPSHSVKFEADTLRFIFDVSDERINCYCIFEDASNLKGAAEWSMGATKLIMSRKK